MNILLIGSGGREHALAWKISQSPLCDQLFIAPGNGGTSSCGTNLNMDPLDFEQITDSVQMFSIDMVVVGPEVPLVEGIYDYFKNDPSFNDVIIIGPSKEAAQLEGSKSYAKKFMLRNNIPTAGYAEFSAENLDEGLNFIDSNQTPIVLKADGLAGGKGVLICQTKEEAKTGLREMIEAQKFGEAGSKVVIEEFLDGIEFSVFALTDGQSYKILPTAKDYKRIGEGDTGLNTGGMGAISPVPFVDDVLMKKVINRIVEPTIAGLKNESLVYKGFIYFGLIAVDGEPYVIEYNCRLGDPETEAILPRLKNDLVELFKRVEDQTLDQQTIIEDERHAATIMLVSGGYPESYEKGKKIEHSGQSEFPFAFHAGTKKVDDTLVTNGGRVISVTAFGNTLQDALKGAYEKGDAIKFEGKYCRKDIGFEFI